MTRVTIVPRAPGATWIVDRARRRCVAVGVHQQVVEHLTQAVPVGHCLERSRLGLDLDDTGRVQLSEALSGRLRRLADVGRLEAQLERVAFDARQIEHVANQPVEAP